MEKLRRLALLLVATSLLIGQTPAPPTNIDDFFRDFTAEWVQMSPDLATATRYFTGAEQNRLERELTPETTAWELQRIAKAREGLAALRKFDRARMTETQRTSAEVLEWQLDTIVRGEPFLDRTFPLEQMNGANVGLVNFLTVTHPLQNLNDARNYVAALGQVAARMDEAIARARDQAAHGVLPPRFILQATIRQMQSFADPAPAQNPFVAVLDQKMSAAKDITPADRADLRAQAEKIVASQIYPAWKRGIATLAAQEPKSTDDAGIWRFPNGAQTYANALRRYTTTDLTPEQIHQIGLNEVARIEKQMDTLLRSMGRTEGSVKERIEKLQLDMQYPDPASDASRAQIMQDVNVILRDAEKRSEALFDKRPKAPVVAQAYPRFRENNAAASYNAPAPDGSRPGTFQFPLRLDRMTKFALKSVIYHETIPGHHFQIAYELEDQTQPRFRRIRAFGTISAFTEGWGLYAERLAAESGWYDGDPAGQLGQLSDELFRARRLVVDTGIHAMHWTRQQAIDYGIEPSEVERYVVWPGQACSYMVGELKIVELRDKAKQTLGPKFQLKEFHNLVLSTGTVPLEVLEQQVNAWVKTVAARR